jgi:release factor glutamine methyltransferase
MSENSQQPMPNSYEAWLVEATARLQEHDIASARLDAEIILAHTIRKGRTYLHAHSDESLADRDRDIANARIDLRTDRVPIAYIIGHKEFYGRRFNVSSSTLIPRPESEVVISLSGSLLPPNLSLFDDDYRVVDVGCGSGNLGLTMKLEYPDLDVSLIDISPHALKIAASNASRLSAEVRIIRSDLLSEYPFTPDMIIANLPYVDPAWERSPETDHEPSIALFADDHGMAIIKKLLDQSSKVQKNGGIVIIEADPEQHETLIHYARERGYDLISTIDYIFALKKAR